MKKSISVDLQLLKKARKACGARTHAEVVQQALEAMIRHDAYQKIRAFRGAESKLNPTPRRREVAGVLVSN
jgi:hypothetical protein